MCIGKSVDFYEDDLPRNLFRITAEEFKKSSLPTDMRLSKTSLLKVAEHSFAGGQR